MPVLGLDSWLSDPSDSKALWVVHPVCGRQKPARIISSLTGSHTYTCVHRIPGRARIYTMSQLCQLIHHPTILQAEPLNHFSGNPD